VNVTVSLHQEEERLKFVICDFLEDGVLIYFSDEIWIWDSDARRANAVVYWHNEGPNLGNCEMVLKRGARRTPGSSSGSVFFNQPEIIEPFS
jgi:hypothetical protein